MAEYNWWDDRTVEDNDEHFCPVLNDTCYGDDINCQKCEVSKAFKADYKEGILSNIIDNGDKIDGYAYSYKTDSEGVPYINIDSVRAMLSKAKDVQPIRRGRFTDLNNGAINHYECSNCKNVAEYDTPYCQWCGAKMDLPEATVKHGEWVERAYGRKQCTCCGKCEDVATDICPNCNAIMRNPEAMENFKELCEQMKALQDVWDIEEAHGKADDILCEALRQLGYNELVDLYEKIDKWYS